MDTKLRPADRRDKLLYKNLFNLYQSEFFAYYRDRFRYVDENGYFDADTVNEIFPPDNAILPFVITEDGKNIGLLLITKPPYASRDYCVEEFYIVPGARGMGAAQRAVRAFWNAHPGVYTLEVFAENRRAYAFWKKLIAEDGQPLSEVPEKDGMTELTFIIS